MSADRVTEGARNGEGPSQTILPSECGSERLIDIKAIAAASLAVGVVATGGVLGGKIIGDCGAYAGGLVGLAASLALAARFSGFGHKQIIS